VTLSCPSDRLRLFIR